MKMYENQSKNGIVMNVGVNVKIYMTGFLKKGVICVIQIRVAASAISHLKFMKNCSCENV